MTQQQKSFKVLLIGDICIDQYQYLEPGKKNPEADAPLYNFSDFKHSYGMAGNVAKCLEALGIKPHLFLKPSYPYSTKTRFILNNKQIMRVDDDCTSSEANLGGIHFYEFDCVVISDYNKGFVTDNTIKTVLEKTNPGTPILLDTKKHNLADFFGCIIKTNLEEAQKATSLPDDGHIITLGKAGAKYHGFNYPALYVPTTVDPCGAGDAFLAGMVYALKVGYNNINSMICYGICNAGVGVQHMGCYQPTEAELLKALEDYNDQIKRNS